MKNNTRYAIIILSSIFLCSCGSKSYYNHLDGMRINNFNEYNSIALAYGNSSNVNLPREKLYQHGASSNKLELVGEKKNGEYEEIIFVSDDNIIQQNSFYIVDTLECNWFTFITVSNNMNNLCNNDNYLQAFGGEGGYFTYLLNKKSGLMYSCESIFNLGIQSANLNHIAYNNDVIFISCDVQNNSIIIKISFENDVIVLQKIIDDTLLEYYSDHIMCDNFGTLFLTNLQHIYRITSNGKIYKCEEDLFFGPDQIAYTNKGLKYYDANGALKDNDKYSFGLYISDNNDRVWYSFAIFPRNFYVWESMYYFFNKDNKYYFVLNNMNLSDRLVSDNAIFRTYEYSLHNGVLSDIKALTKEEYVIIKEFENGGKTVDYSYGFYERSNVKDGVYLQDRVYLLIDDEISYVNLIDMEENKLVSHLIFKDFILGNSKEIYFNGTDEDLNLVYGIIGLDDSVTMNIVKNNFEILYIPPIKIACSY